MAVPPSPFQVAFIRAAQPAQCGGSGRGASRGELELETASKAVAPRRLYEAIEQVEAGSETGFDSASYGICYRIHVSPSCRCLCSLLLRKPNCKRRIVSTHSDYSDIVKICKDPCFGSMYISELAHSTVLDIDIDLFM